MKNKKSLSYRIYSKKNLKMAEEKTNLLGVNNKLDAVDLLNTRLFLSIVVFIGILYFVDFGYFIAPIVTFLVYELFFPVVVDQKIEKRRRVLEKDSLYFFEILVLSLEAGRNIKTAIEVTTNNIDSELSDEFKKVVKDVNYGKDLKRILIQFYIMPFDYERIHIKEIEQYRKNEKSIGIPIVVERSFFQLSETERREFLVSSMLSKFSTLENVVKNKKLDTNMKKLVHDFSYNLRTFV